jgi:hypothetical protein
VGCLTAIAGILTTDDAFVSNVSVVCAASFEILASCVFKVLALFSLNLILICPSLSSFIE